jgi:hypothetical protein
MTDRVTSPAYQMLPRSARRVFAAIARAIGDGSSASVSYVAFSLDHGIARKSVSSSLKLLDHLGLVDIEPGRRLVNVFRFSNRWRTVDEVEALRLAALAREVRPCRRFEKRRDVMVKSTVHPKPVKPVPVSPKPMTVERRPYRRQVPSLAGRRAVSCQRPRPSPLASVTKALPVSTTCSTRLGSASPVRFCAFQCAR